MKKYLCIDIGGSNIKYATILQDGTFVSESKQETTVGQCQNLNLFLDKINELYNQFKPVDGIALSMPGMIDVNSGYMYTGGSIVCCDNTNIIDNLHKFIPQDINITVENDAKAATWAEREDGSLKDVDNAVMIVVGTGLGGTVMIDRKILRGANLFAGEFSFTFYNVKEPMAIDDDHLTARQSTPSNIRKLYKIYSGCYEDITCEQIFALAKQGNKNAYRAIRETVRMLSMLICNLQCTIDPQLISIGGGISSEPLFIEMLQTEVKDIATQGWRGRIIPKVVCSKYHNHANLLGALYFHLNKVENKVL